MIHYDHPLYRPPAEADNVIVQATYGCSHNSCTFCSMYKSKRYRIRDTRDVFKEIDELAACYPDAHRVFLADGDALSLGTEHLLAILTYLHKAFPRLSRVSMYATAQNLLNKSEDDLRLLRENGLSLVYFGIETGNDSLLKRICKGVEASQIITALNKAEKAKIKVSATVILGIGSHALSKEHIEDTAKIVNATKINYLSTLQLGLEDGVKERFFKSFGDTFTMPDDHQLLDEQKRFIELLSPTHSVIFRSNHASNALHLSGTLPKDKARLLREIESAQSIGERAFVPKLFRGF